MSTLRARVEAKGVQVFQYTYAEGDHDYDEGPADDGRVAGVWLPAPLAAAVLDLIAYVEADAGCPCCEATPHADDCTFATDCPVEHERVAKARAALARLETT